MPRKSGGSTGDTSGTSSNVGTINPTITLPATSIAPFQIHPAAGQKPIQVRYN